MIANSENSHRCVTVLGGGSWGTALSVLLAQNFEQVRIFTRNTKVVTSINESHKNQCYLPDLLLPNNISATSILKDAITSQLNFVIVVPSKAYAQTLLDLYQVLEEENRLSVSNKSLSLVWGTKGIDPTTHQLLSNITQSTFPQTDNIGVISGPSFAKETVKKLPTALTIASSNENVAKAFTDWFKTPTTRIYYHDDIIGVQIGGAIKNVLAIAAGISDGLGFGANARAALITRGLSEMVRLGTALGGRANTFMGLTGIGDLVLTCTDNQSRNRRFGIGLGKEKPIDQIICEIGQEIEGIQTVKEVMALKQSQNIEMPICEQVHAVIYEGLDAKTAVSQLLSRELKAESD